MSLFQLKNKLHLIANKSDKNIITTEQINASNEVTKKDFIRQSDESFVMSDNCRKNLLTTWQKRKKEIIEHPYLKEKIPIGLLPYVQAMLLARFLREDLDDYPVFLMR